MDILAFRQFLVPGIAALLVAGLFAGGSMYLDEYGTQVQQESAAADTALMALRRDIKELRGDTTFVADKMPQYQALREKGFLDPQSRLQAANLLESLALTHKINELRYEFRPEERIKLNLPRTDMDVVSSTIIVQLNALFDEEIFAFLEAVTKGLKGQVSIRAFRISRTDDGMETILKRVSSGSRPSSVSAHIIMDWASLGLRETVAGAANPRVAK